MILKLFSFGILYLSSIIILQVYSIPTGVVVDTNDQYDDLLPHEVKNFVNSFTAEEKAELKKFAELNSANFTIFDTQSFNFLKEEASGLFNKLTVLRDVIDAKLSGVEPESRTFIDNAIQRLLKAFSEDGLISISNSLKTFGKETIKNFDKLSKNAQNEFIKAFPNIASYATSDIARLIFNRLADLDLFSKNWTIRPTNELDSDHINTDSTEDSLKHQSPYPVITEPDDSDSPATMHPTINDDNSTNVDEPLFIKKEAHIE
ncbi:unnamed protein product [Thelazia callipaeda]|uniref:Fatty-acid and retinol-binding protein 1 n=1 Tax=Thelazia callipaeda TaxID=103827 RepID=A0A0N5CQL6_THECL|nr:unnamed protein product [Thelazia callipaeda]